MQSPQSIARRDAATEYRKLVRTLAAKAARMGSNDAEAAAQEALKRSLANSLSRGAVEFYFQDDPPATVPPPEWRLDQLLAWLHGVLRFVVSEERSRMSFRREVPVDDMDALDAHDHEPSRLERLIDDQQQSIVRECLAELTDDYRTVLTLRMEGLKYADIAARLGVNENTVATWLRRGTRAAIERIRARLDGSVPLPNAVSTQE
ncbi:MAG TPA: RNA polymerase sigma factor [Vicinamibacterales bacterium]|nr:RNA polymerase sigma factor [Vicinamibacterales bacterium]